MSRERILAFAHARRHADALTLVPKGATFNGYQRVRERERERERESERE